MAGPRRVAALLTRRLLPALLSAAGVTLLAAGLLVYGAPPGVSSDASAQPTAPAPPGTATPGASSALASPTGGATAPGSAAPPGSSGPASSGGTSTSPAPAIATRIVIPALRIDLPIVAGNGRFPLCDVAQYWVGPLGTGPDAVQPGEPGTTWIFAHARAGMFLPLLTASQVDGGKGMIGYAVQVYTSDSKVYWYSIDTVRRHTAVTDWSLGARTPPGESRLVLQTSEGPLESSTKLQLGASLQLVQPADGADAHPTPRPRVCS